MNKVARAERRCPALLVTAPASGQGKTTVTAALARLLARRGWRVRVFKCGPDFLDPFWHQLASGQVVHNLDLWMTGERDVGARLHAAAGEADVILVEGVMGLHDGTPSAADLARRIGLHVLVVAQAGAMAQTLGAVVHGLRHYRQPASAPLPWAGVLANGVASEGHARLLQESIDPPEAWLGHLPRSEAMQLPERRLGLVAAQELGDEALSQLDAAADLLAVTPLGQLSMDDWRTRWSVPFEAPHAAEVPPLLAGRTIAVARDAAFAFTYAANLETLQALGARLQFFSPLAGDALPACDAVWLPGGYPELHATTLSARTDLRDQLRQHAAAGRPIWAEGGGLMVLMDELMTAEEQAHAMWGLLPGRARVQKKLAGLGMQSWRALLADAGIEGGGDSPLPALRGHSFHYGVVDSKLAPLAHTEPAPGSARKLDEAVLAGGPGGRVRGSFFHAWFASSPRAAAALFMGQIDRQRLMGMGDHGGGHG